MSDSKDSKAIVEKVQNLGKLALSTDDKGEPTEEARTAAVTVMRIIKENELVVVPRSEIQRMIAGAAELETSKQAAQKNLLMGVALGYFGGKALKLG
jgi:hypothetical protein